MPASTRIVLGILLLFGGILGALPILGFWMIPLGLLILSRNFNWARCAALFFIRHIYRHKRKGTNN